MSYEEPIEEPIETYREEPLEDNEIHSEESDIQIPEEEVSEGNLSTTNEVIKTTDLCLIAGKRGSGKTNLLLYLIKQLTQSKMNLIIIDPVYDLRDNLPKNDPRIVHIPYGNRKKFDAILLKLLKSGWKGMLIVDEADRFFPNRTKLTNLENHFIQIGRHYGIGMIAVTRRLSNLHTDLATQASKLFMFKHWNRNDLMYLKESSLGEYAALLVGLEKYHFLYLNPDVDIAQICTPVPIQK